MVDTRKPKTRPRAFGPRNAMWKGGRSIASNGYVLIRVGSSHHLADIRGYAYEHRIVAEQKIGRRLSKGEIVHHKNEITTDNRPDNLEVLPSRAHHRAEHRTFDRGKRGIDDDNPTIQCACGCGRTFTKFDASNRPRKFISGHNRPFPKGNIKGRVHAKTKG